MFSLLDRLATRLIGLPVQIRLAISPRLLLGKLSHARILIRGARAGGLFLEEVDIRVSGLTIVPSWPPRLRVAHVEARVHLDQKSLDAWSKRVGLPVRLRLRPGRVVARTGIAGLRLSEADMDVQIEDRTLRLVPRRINVLGMEASGSRLGRVTLPLPRLPRDARLESLDPEESALRACLAVDGLDEELTRERLHAVRKMASQVMHPTGAEDSSTGDPDLARTGARSTGGRSTGGRSTGGRSTSGRSTGTRSIGGRPGADRRPTDAEGSTRAADSRRTPRPRPAGIIEATVLDVADVLRRDDADGRHIEKPE